jgi:hypothetical protein
MKYFSIILFTLLIFVGAGCSNINPLASDPNWERDTERLKHCFDSSNSQKDIYECEYQFQQR